MVAGFAANTSCSYVYSSDIILVMVVIVVAVVFAIALGEK